MTPMNARPIVFAAAGLVAACAQTEVATEVEEAPVELGLVDWERDYSVATARARTEDRDLLLLFQEVPG